MVLSMFSLQRLAVASQVSAGLNQARHGCTASKGVVLQFSAGTGFASQSLSATSADALRHSAGHISNVFAGYQNVGGSRADLPCLG